MNSIIIEKEQPTWLALFNIPNKKKYEQNSITFVFRLNIIKHKMSDNRLIYLDNNATTPTDPRAVEAML